MSYLTAKTPIKWTDLKSFSYASESANLTDSANNLKDPQIVEVRINTGAYNVYGGGTMGPSEVIEGQHSYEIDFQAQLTGVRPFFTAGGLSDSGYIGNTIQTPFYVEFHFTDCPGDTTSATRWLHIRFKGCRFQNLRARSQHGGDMVMSGTILAQDVKSEGKPTTD
jgi:hypothetical protein